MHDMEIRFLFLIPCLGVIKLDHECECRDLLSVCMILVCQECFDHVCICFLVLLLLDFLIVQKLGNPEFTHGKSEFPTSNLWVKT